jgi:hypothetical protein
LLFGAGHTSRSRLQTTNTQHSNSSRRPPPRAAVGPERQGVPMLDAFSRSTTRSLRTDKRARRAPPETQSQRATNDRPARGAQTSSDSASASVRVSMAAR